MKEGDILDDCQVTKIVDQNHVHLKCLICGHEKVCTARNLKRQHNYHSYKTCKKEYLDNLIGKRFGDFLIKDYEVRDDGIPFLILECQVCGHVRRVKMYDLKRQGSEHCETFCKEDYIQNEVGKIYGDYKILSFDRKDIGYLYYNVECIKCHVQGVRSLSALKKRCFRHGDECFKNLRGEYKNIFSVRFNNMMQRCYNPNNSNYAHYGARGIKVCYPFVVDFYLDNIDAFKEYAKIHGVNDTTFDRIDVNGNYEKGNIRMATQAIQSANQTRKVYFVLKKGDCVVLSDNAMEFGRRYGANGRSVGNVVRGDSKTADGWSLVAKSKNLEDLSTINVTTKLITT